MTNSRRKGKRVELGFVPWLRMLWPNASRNLDQTREGGADYIEVPYAIESKGGKRPDIYAAVKQVREAAKGRNWRVLVKRDREEAIVVMSLEAWIEVEKNAAKQ